MTLRATRLSTAILLSIVTGCSSNKNSDATLGAQNQGLGQTAQGDQKFEKAKAPDINADTQFAAGQLAEAQGNPTGALERYEAALKENPQHEKSVYRSAIVYTQLKEYPKSVDQWEKYIKLTHGQAEGYSNLALTYELAGNLAAAETSYKRGLSKDPSSEACRVNYGLMLARSGRVLEGREQLGRALKPEEVAYNLGSVFEGQGNKSEARAQYQEALRIKPDMDDAKQRLAAIN